MPVMLSIIAGPPAAAPASVSAVPVAKLHLLISWEAPFVPFNVALSYEVAIHDLTTGSNETVVTSNGTYSFVGRERSCNVYSFVVAALNAAGRGPASVAVTASLPAGRISTVLCYARCRVISTHAAVPDASEINVSHTMRLIRNEFTCEGEFMVSNISALNTEGKPCLVCQPAASCPAWPVLNYTVVLVENSSGLQTELGPFFESEDRVKVTLNNVIENKFYTYHVRAHSGIGYNESQQFSFCESRCCVHACNGLVQICVHRFH